jgi:hypothetical protein
MELEKVLPRPIGRFLAFDKSQRIQMRSVLELHPKHAAEIGALVVGPDAPNIEVPEKLAGSEPSFPDALDPSLQLRQRKIFNKDSFHFGKIKPFV